MAAILRVDTIPRGGKCVGHDPKMWFPHADKNEPGKFSEKYRLAAQHTLIAKDICSRCPIKQDCLSYGLYHEAFGIWGGTTERERRTMRRKLNITLIPKESNFLGLRGQKENLRD
jgi:hypothetical protein